MRISPEEVGITELADSRKIYPVKEFFVEGPWYQMITPVGVRNVLGVNNHEFRRRHRRLLSGPLPESSVRMMMLLLIPKIELAIQK